MSGLLQELLPLTWIPFYGGKKIQPARGPQIELFEGVPLCARITHTGNWHPANSSPWPSWGPGPSCFNTFSEVLQDREEERSENTEDLYAGVEFAPIPEDLVSILAKLSKSFSAFQGLARDQYAISCKINTQKGSERIVRAAFEFARTHKRRKVTVVHKANVVRATDGLFLEAAKEIARAFPEIKMDDMGGHVQDGEGFSDLRVRPRNFHPDFSNVQVFPFAKTCNACRE
jgi:hypothetical protein